MSTRKTASTVPSGFRSGPERANRCGPMAGLYLRAVWADRGEEKPDYAKKDYAFAGVTCANCAGTSATARSLTDLHERCLQCDAGALHRVRIVKRPVLHIGTSHVVNALNKPRLAPTGNRRTNVRGDFCRAV